MANETQVRLRFLALPSQRARSVGEKELNLKPVRFDRPHCGRGSRTLVSQTCLTLPTRLHNGAAHASPLPSALGAGPSPLLSTNPLTAPTIPPVELPDDREAATGQGIEVGWIKLATLRVFAGAFNVFSLRTFGGCMPRPKAWVVYVGAFDTFPASPASP